MLWCRRGSFPICSSIHVTSRSSHAFAFSSAVAGSLLEQPIQSSATGDGLEVEPLTRLDTHRHIGGSI